MARKRNRRAPQPQNGRRGGGQAQMPVLGIVEVDIPKDGSVTSAYMDFARLPHLKNMGSGKHEYRVTSASASITVATRSGNDGEIVALFYPKAWTPTSAADMKSNGGAYRYISAAAWSVNMSSASDWTNVANQAGYVYLCGYALEKVTKVSVLIRGNVQFR
uniref:Uncharacterized protein n=1 Tax=Riboviria sp. TaxID=2585031 RepID=A0A514DCH0_9VIRU|nr:MAG: hypothetical protein H2RhizoL4914731_000001 [Riboviria sp.]